jgi:lipopolysaccharide/colanic/teichoic acid biosynthesis glycosyltransferase
MMKRVFDAMVAGIGLLFLFPLFAIVAILIKLDSFGLVFFRQERIGRKFRSFLIYKFRTMVKDAPQRGGFITFGEDPRITCVGRLLRKTKVDELPQLINVFKGDMSLAGPRPEVPRYVEMFRRDYEEILGVRPGITDLASLKYGDEAEILGMARNPEEEYVRRVLPEKIRLAKEYIRNSSFSFDLALICRTVINLGLCRFSS